MVKFGICLTHMTAAQFRKLTENNKLDEQLGQRGHKVEYLQELPESWKMSRHDMSSDIVRGEYSSADCAYALLTDDPDTAAMALRKGMVVFGLGGDTRFDGVSMVFQSAEAITAASLEMEVCHMYHVPYVIGTQDGVTLRESVNEDFEELYEIFEESGLDMFAIDLSCVDNANPSVETHETEENAVYSGSEISSKQKSWDELFSQGRSGRPIRRSIPLNHRKIAVRDAFIRYVKSQYPFYRFGLWTVLDSEGSIAGWCGFSNAGSIPDLGYIVKSSMRRQHIAFKACTVALAFAREELGLPQVELHVHADNLPSVRLAHKLGFVHIDSEIYRLVL